MSVYAEYDVISKDYDETRLPHSAHLYLGLVYTLTGKTAQQLHLLDAGCGTGNHVKFLLDKGLAKATVFDANSGMLEKAKPKLKSYIDQGRVVVEQHLLPSIPFDDSKFDVVMCNQVLHHITSLEDKEYSAIRKFLEEAYRVLKPNGVLLVNLCTPYQLDKGFWYARLLPGLNDEMLKRNMEPEEFLAMMRNSGFTNEGIVVEPLDLVFTDEWYFNEKGMLDPHWRKGESLTASASGEELDKAVETVEGLIKEGKMREFMQESDKMRRNVGQVSIYYARKV